MAKPISPVGHNYIQRRRMIKKLGFESYSEYMESDLWNNLKKQILKEKKCCEVCGSLNDLQVHHRSYTFMATDGVGRTKGLVLVCEKCHSDIHKIAENENIGLVKATKRLLKGKNF